jgi:cation diffusion facilitator CzcD-associated flavoprotein CzcO
MPACVTTVGRLHNVAGMKASEPPKCAVIGAGMAGILSAIELPRAGFTSVTVFEKADRVGGTWRENTYPGLACDVPSHLYSYSFAPSPDWSHRFSPGAEIQAYLERVAAGHGVLERVRFGDEVVRCELVGRRWHLTTAAGHQDDFDVVIAATGVLHHPKLPDLEGLDTFRGPAFHSARWDHRVDIEGAQVGLIGTGSTAIQIVSAIVGSVSKLSLFQRTAQWVMPQENPSYSEAERAGFRHHPDLLEDARAQEMGVFDLFSSAVIDKDSELLGLIESACLENLENNVKDPELRERLRPDYRAACKRLIISPDFYAAIQQPTAELVTDQIQHIEADGVRTTDGRLHELDVLVLATGFKVDSFMRPIEIVGRDGLTLERAWSPRPEAYLSISIPGFPNLFMLNGPNGPVGNFSLIEVAELQLGYILQLLETVRSGVCHQISASPEALSAYEVARAQAAERTVWVTGCRSWYLDDRGLPAVWPWPFEKFREAMRRPDLTAYELE